MREIQVRTPNLSVNANRIIRHKKIREPREAQGKSVQSKLPPRKPHPPPIAFKLLNEAFVPSCNAFKALLTETTLAQIHGPLFPRYPSKWVSIRTELRILQCYADRMICFLILCFSLAVR